MRLTLAIICLVLFTGCGSDDSTTTPTNVQESPFAGTWRFPIILYWEFSYQGDAEGTINASGDASFIATLPSMDGATPDPITVRVDLTADSHNGAVAGNIYLGSQMIGSLTGFISTVEGRGVISTGTPTVGYWQAERVF